MITIDKMQLMSAADKISLNLLFPEGADTKCSVIHLKDEHCGLAKKERL